MRVVVVLLAALALPAAGCGGAGDSATTSSDRVEIGQGLTGPTGLEATLYANGLQHVSAFAFDAGGQLWATTSGAADHTKDGVFLVTRAGARPVKVVGGVEGPLGLVWRAGRLYVASLGRVDVFSGLSGTRFARRKTVIAEPSGHGWNNAIVALPDGRLAMVHIVGVRPLREQVPLVGDDRHVPSRRQRRAGLRPWSPRSVRARLRPRHRGAPRLDEPARRPRCADPGRLACARP